ncbi:MAG TPA: glycosyl hydrolase family 8 [Acidimicrobiales bacterium]|nr:glycosyl hydrolase family 8 [Acidimicrobiales bacterium]
MSDALRVPAPLTSKRSIAGLIALCAAVLAAVAVFAVHGRGGAGGAASAASAAPATSLADAPAAFLDHYEQADGRVVRIDQGGDTVSEGQAYAMLVAAGAGDRGRFAAAWGWAQAHLVQPDGLMAWRYVGDHVVDTMPATDADLGAAAALISAGGRFGDPAYTTAGRRMAAAILAHEVATTPAGPVLAAGPWATTDPVRVDPSYLATPELATVTAAAGGAWVQVLADARHEIASLTAGGTLPSDWAIIGGDGQVHPSAPPGDPSAAVRFGYDAARLPIWLASSCDPADRAVAASLRPALARGGGRVVLDLGGTPAPGQRAPVGALALAAARRAAGASTAGAAVASALAINRASPTYYGSAWLALADLGFSHHLGGC